MKEKRCILCGKEFIDKRNRRNVCSFECGIVMRDLRQKLKNVGYCKLCGTLRFGLSPSYLKKVSTCGKECGAELRKLKTLLRNYKKCICCGEIFVTFNPNNKFCSRTCYFAIDKAKGTLRRAKVCKNCGKVFTNNKNPDGKYCSRECSVIAFGKEHKGRKNPNWRGGVSFGKYCPKFNKEFKERVRNFWERKCGICKFPQKRHKKKLHVHHVQYDKGVCCNTTPPLFIPLCDRCHGKTNFNREYWEKVLTNYIMIYFNGECYNSTRRR